MRVNIGSALNRTLSRLAQVSGGAVQTYSEPVLLEHMRYVYQQVFKNNFHSDWTHEATWTLDGSTGVVTTLLDTIEHPLRRFNDIHWIAPDEDRVHRLTKPNDYADITKVTGDQAAHVIPYNDPKRIFKILPPTAVGDVYVVYRSSPFDPNEAWSIEDEIDFDDDVLVTGAAFQYMETDGTNPDHTETLKGMFASSLQSYLQEGTIPTTTSPAGAVYPTTWMG